MKKNILLLFSIFFLLACDSNDVDCSTVLCAGPPNLVFETLSEGMNVFDEGLYTVEDVTLTGPNVDAIEISVRESNFSNTTTQLLYIENIDWQTGTNDFILGFENDFSISLSADIAISSAQCCGGIPRMEAFRVNDTPQEDPNQVITLDLN